MLPWTCETLPLQCSEVELGQCCSCTVGRRPGSSMPRGFFPSRARWLSPRTHLLGAWYATRLIFAGKSTAICAASSFTQSSAPCQVHVARHSQGAVKCCQDTKQTSASSQVQPRRCPRQRLLLSRSVGCPGSCCRELSGILTASNCTRMSQNEAGMTSKKPPGALTAIVFTFHWSCRFRELSSAPRSGCEHPGGGWPGREETLAKRRLQ